MGKPTGFMETQRSDRSYRPVDERVRHYKEFFVELSEQQLSEQGGRCMDCGIPFCHNGCPVNNVIPDWNDLVYRNRWREALDVLHSTNNFPEFTGRICPAPCEAACTLNIDDNPVTIKTIECAIVDRGWESGWIVPMPSSVRTGKKVAVVGSGPAGLACSQQLARVGHEVHLYEKNQRMGGLMRYGIPDFKMEKMQIDRRLEQMAAEGVVFHCGVHVGVDITAQALSEQFDAVVLTGGAEHPRDLPVEGREFSGVHFAMEFLPQQNRRVGGEEVSAPAICAKDKDVIVIGGGDTGSDCIGTSIRQGCRSVTQLEILPQPPEKEDKALSWPDWPLKLRTSSSHEEGAARDWSVSTRSVVGDGQGNATHLRCVRVEWGKDEEGRHQMQEVEGSEFDLPADLVLLAMGFVHPVHQGLLESLNVELDPRGNILADTQNYSTSVDKVFAAGDMRRGQSLVVWAIREGRQAARAVDEFLMGSSELPR
ncbi:MAG: glutamate synthase subunit beta [Gammaproteobacteria bacterium]|nr:glutamate synthase subunit beta [Gammaproteobacteria bacterium]